MDDAVWLYASWNRVSDKRAVVAKVSNNSLQIEREYYIIRQLYQTADGPMHLGNWYITLLYVHVIELTLECVPSAPFGIYFLVIQRTCSCDLCRRSQWSIIQSHYWRYWHLSTTSNTMHRYYGIHSSTQYYPWSTQYGCILLEQWYGCAIMELCRQWNKWQQRILWKISYEWRMEKVPKQPSYHGESYHVYQPWTNWPY